jgi:hypothetical protein
MEKKIKRKKERLKKKMKKINGKKNPLICKHMKIIWK